MQARDPGSGRWSERGTDVAKLHRVRKRCWLWVSAAVVTFRHDVRQIRWSVRPSTPLNGRERCCSARARAADRGNASDDF